MNRMQESFDVIRTLPTRLPGLAGGLRDAVGLGRPAPATGWFDGRTALGIGILLGAGAALLLAPRTGRQQRQELRARLEHLRDETRGFVRRATGNVGTAEHGRG